MRSNCQKAGPYLPNRAFIDVIRPFRLLCVTKFAFLTFGRAIINREYFIRNRMLVVNVARALPSLATEIASASSVAGGTVL